jgi:hypothetical protein
MSKDQASVTSGTRSFPARIRLGLGLLAGHCQDHPGGYWILVLVLVLVMSTEQNNTINNGAFPMLICQRYNAL